MELIRNLWRRKLRSILTITGIFMGIVALTTMGAMAEHFNSLIDGGVTYFGGAIQVADAKSGDSFRGGGFMQLAKADEIAKVDGVQAVTPLISVSAKPGDLNTVSFGIPDYISTNDPNNQYSSFKTTFASGRGPQADGEVMLGSAFATEFNKKVGDRITLPKAPPDAKPDFVSHNYTVVGTLNKTLTAPDTGAFVTLHDAQTLLGDNLPAALKKSVDPYQLAESMTVYGKPNVNLDNLADKINRDVTEVKATKPSVIVNSFKAGGAIFTAITTVAALLALVIGGLSVVNTMLMAVSERVREIGLKKAVGARTGNILREFVTESTLIGTIGGVLGFAVGVGITALLGNSVQGGLFLVTPRLTILSLGFAIVLGALAGVLPAFRAARMDPVAALRSVG
ncbi:MAG TPA: FtsX-like permease family protein [Candidatus Dormibacteraeota bacterium]|nr:FtsX-like permease family protein [Candidatus Dormibacteraeota bacterium]